MALPSNYKQIAVGAPNTPSAPTSGGGGSSRSRSSGAGGGSDRNKDTTPIFTHSNYGNPAFTPQKAGKSSSSKNQANESRAPKPPKPPEKPVLPYMRYSKRIWDSVKAQYPDLKLWELGKKIGALWKQLNEAEKQEFIDEYEADKVEYEKALKAYHNSPAYQAYMAAKSKVKSDADIHETPSRSSGKSQQERRIDIQPAEDEDDQDEGYSFKHLAYARYLRNHRLINEIFSDAVVPDVRSVVTTQRMQVLKRQVSSLTMHQTKLEAELQQMEEKFEAKKQRMMESSEAFQEELKRHCRPAVDEDTFQKMVQRIYEEMKRDRQRLEDPAIAGHSCPAPVSGAAINRGIDDKLLVKKECVPQAASGKTPSVVGEVASGNKTEPEPMDIEPPAKLMSQKTNSEAVKSQKPQASEVLKDSKMASMAGGGQTNSSVIASKLSHPGKVPTPTPTPTPPPAQPAAQSEQIAAGPTTIAAGAPLPAPTPPLPQLAQQPPPPPPQQQVPPAMPPSMHPHHAPPPPPHPHLPPHMAPHQPPPMSGMPPHSGYGSYAGPPPAGPTRSPYYQPQYGPTPPHPSQAPYGQYTPYSHYQQSPYGPPPPPPGSHYMNPARPPPQHNGAAGAAAVGHYAEHGAPVPAQQPPPGHLPPHDVYGQPPPPPPPHNQVLPTNAGPAVPGTGAPAALSQPTAAGDTVIKSETDKKDD